MLVVLRRTPSLLRLQRARAPCAVVKGSVGGGVDSAVAAAAFSSNRRTRFRDDDASDEKRHAKLVSAMHVKQQEQFKKLRDALVREERMKAANAVQQENENATAASTSAAVGASAVSHTIGAHVSSDRTKNEVARARRAHRQVRDYERMMIHRAKHQERVKHLPLFREESTLWRLRGGGGCTLLDFDQLPDLAFGGRVDVIHSSEEERAFISYLAQQKVVGVDTESMPSFDKRTRQNPVCLIQIATLERSFLYRIPRGGALPPHLRTLLEDPAVVKVGHSLDDDCRLLAKSKLVSAVPTTIDTLPVATKLGCLRPGLETLCKLFLGGKISKEMQVSNWEAHELSAEQIRYAATDAWAPLGVMLEMIRLNEARQLLLVKSYNSAKGKSTSGDLDGVLATLEECLLDYRAQTFASESVI